MNDLTDLLGESRKQLLDLVKRRGEVTAGQAHEAIDLAVTTIRQHLTELEHRDLVERHSRPEGRGRPKAYFRLTARGRQMYPSRDDHLLTELLDFLSREGFHGAIDEFFRDYWNRRGRQLQRRFDEAGAESLPQRLEILREFLAEQGFMPEIKLDDEGLELRECNCPLEATVASTRLPCRLEAQFLEEALQQSLSRVEYIPDGHNACVYCFDNGEE